MKFGWDNDKLIEDGGIIEDEDRPIPHPSTPV